MIPLRRMAWIAAAAGGALCVLGAFIDRPQFLRSWLVAFLFWATIPLGCLALTMLHHLVGGGWGFVIRRITESAATTLLLLAVLFAPLLAGLSDLYPWARLDLVEADEVLRHKRAWLNPTFYATRAAICFAVWIALAFILIRWSRRQDTGGTTMTWRLQALSGPGLAIFGLSVTVAAIDWAMSLEPHWFSAIYGLLWMAGCALSAMAFATAAVIRLAERPPLAQELTTGRLHDLGNLLLAFLLLWAYMTFIQFLIIWSADLPEEAAWYLHRSHGGWPIIGAALVTLHFGAPFILLLSRDIKRSRVALGGVALAVLAARWLDVFWQVAPAYGRGLRLHWLDAAAWMCIGGLWTASFLVSLGRAPLVPAADPRFAPGVLHA